MLAKIEELNQIVNPMVVYGEHANYLFFAAFQVGIS